MTTGLENPPALQTPTELGLSQTALVQRGLELADLALARLTALAASEQTLPVWQQIHIEMIPIPAGPFLMGSDEDKDVCASEQELPQHTVNLPAFYIARVPVTNEQYKQFVDVTGYTTPKHWVGGPIPAGEEKHPVVNVTWYDAQAFCVWAGVCLPTEAEWEKAARGTDGRTYPWGEEATNERFIPNPYITVPVGGYPKGASPYGVLDTIGHVLEWTNSIYYSYPYRADDGRERQDVDAIRVLRGGPSEGGDDEWDRHCADRGGCEANFISDLIGFRVATK